MHALPVQLFHARSLIWPEQVGRQFERGITVIAFGKTGPATPIKRTPFYAQLYVQVLTAIVAGGLIGHFAPETGVALKPLGDGFIRLVKMIIAPVIFLTIVTGIAGMRNLGSVGRVAGKAFAYFLFFSTIALIVGLIVANVVQPGAGMNIDPATLETGAVDDYVKKAKDQTIVSFLLGIIPETVAGAFVDGNLLQVLFLAISFGVALSTAGEAARPVVRLFEALGAGFFRLVAIFMRAAPIGAFGALPSPSANMASAPSPTSRRWSPLSTSLRCCSSLSCWGW